MFSQVYDIIDRYVSNLLIRIPPGQLLLRPTITPVHQFSLVAWKTLNGQTLVS